MYVLPRRQLYYFITPVSDRAVARRWPAGKLHRVIERDMTSFKALVKSVFPGTIYFVNTGPASPGKWVRVNKEVRGGGVSVAAISGFNCAVLWAHQ